MPPVPRPAVVHWTEKFQDSYKRLPSDIKETVNEKVGALRVDWGQSWLDKKRLPDGVRWRFKVNGQYRMVAVKGEGDEFVLEFVGTKNQVKKKYYGA